MRNIRIAVAVAALAGSAFALSAHAEPECLTYTGTTNPIFTIGGPVPVTVNAPGTVDPDPAACIRTVQELAGQ